MKPLLHKRFSENYWMRQAIPILDKNYINPQNGHIVQGIEREFPKL